MPPAIEKAIFTSIRSGRLDGYQLAAASPGLSERDRQEISRWGPAHDSLLEPGVHAESVNFHRLASGLYCISRTLHAGAEYSGRGGLRVFTLLLLAPPEALERFANNPFRLLEAATAAGHAEMIDPPSPRLEPIHLAGGATPVDRILLARLARLPGPRAMAALVQAVLENESLCVGSRAPLRRLMSGLFSLLPVELRPMFSFSTGLKPSRQRSFRIQPLDGNLPRGAARRGGEPVLLSLDEASQREPTHPWAELAARVIGEGAAAALCRALSIARPDLRETDLGALAQRIGERLVAGAREGAEPAAVA
jgi:hypothetical protein